MLSFLLGIWTLCTHQTGGKCLCAQPPASTLVGSLPYIFVTTLCRGELTLSSVTCGEGQVNASTWFPTDSYTSGPALVFGLHNWISTSCPFLRQLKAPGLVKSQTRFLASGPPLSPRFLRLHMNRLATLGSCFYCITSEWSAYDISHKTQVPLCPQPFHLTGWYNKASYCTFCIISRHPGYRGD